MPKSNKNNDIYSLRTLLEIMRVYTREIEDLYQKGMTIRRFQRVIRFLKEFPKAGQSISELLTDFGSAIDHKKINQDYIRDWTKKTDQIRSKFKEKEATKPIPVEKPSEAKKVKLGISEESVINDMRILVRAVTDTYSKGMLLRRFQKIIRTLKKHPDSLKDYHRLIHKIKKEHKANEITAEYIRDITKDVTRIKKKYETAPKHIIDDDLLPKIKEKKKVPSKKATKKPTKTKKTVAKTEKAKKVTPKKKDKIISTLSESFLTLKDAFEQEAKFSKSVSKKLDKLQKVIEKL